MCYLEWQSADVMLYVMCMCATWCSRGQRITTYMYIHTHSHTYIGTANLPYVSPEFGACSGLPQIKFCSCCLQLYFYQHTHSTNVTMMLRRGRGSEFISHNTCSLEMPCAEIIKATVNTLILRYAWTLSLYKTLGSKCLNFHVSFCVIENLGDHIHVYSLL